MLSAPDLLRILLTGCVISMAVLAALFLRSRHLAPAAYFGWGLLVVAFPLLGPFLTILAAPGSPRR